MKKSTDPIRIQKLIDDLGLSSSFNTEGLRFEIRVYDKEEQLATPFSKTDYFSFITSGRVRIYQLNEDSTINMISTSGSGDILGTSEFCFGKEENTVYLEALTRVECLTLPFAQQTRDLRCDSEFLMWLLKYEVSTQRTNKRMTHAYSGTEDKIMFYIENMCADKILENVSDAVTALSCSRRQIYRILKKLCEEGRLERCRRGCYRPVNKDK